MGIFRQFPYSNFHELNLDWFLNKFEILLNEWENTEEDWKELKEYVENFFENLDLTEEVSDKLNEMYEDGTLMVLLAEYLTWYVTPEMYGAVGDGVTDDTTAFSNAVNSGKPVICLSEQYKLNTIYLNENDIFIYGNKCTLNFGHNSGFIIPYSGHGIDIIGCNFELEFNKDSSDTSNASISVAGIITGEYSAENITIKDCSFNGGVFGVSASSCKNFNVKNCKFGAFTYKPVDGAGGYGVLLQSCIDSSVDSCEFRMGEWGRHDVYVSIDRSKTTHLPCKNIRITNCLMNHHDLHLDDQGLFYSPATQSINVRHSRNVIIENCTFIEVTSGVTSTSVDGDIYGLIITNCSGINPVYNAGTYEAKYFFNVAGANHTEISITNCSLIDVPADYLSFANASNAIIMINNCILSTTRIVIGNNTTVLINNITSNIDYYVIRFIGNDLVKGRVRNVIDNDLTGLKYSKGSASFELNFFEFIKNTIQTTVTSNGNGIVDSNTIDQYGINPFNNIIMSVLSSVNNRLLIPYNYNNRLMIKVFDLTMTLVANEEFTLTLVYETEE